MDWRDRRDFTKDLISINLDLEKFKKKCSETETTLFIHKKANIFFLSVFQSASEIYFFTAAFALGLKDKLA